MASAILFSSGMQRRYLFINLLLREGTSPLPPPAKLLQLLQLRVSQKPGISCVHLCVPAEAPEVFVNSRRIQEYGQAAGNIAVNAPLLRMEHIQMILKTYRFGLEHSRIDHMRHDATSFLLRREPAHHRIKAVAVQPLLGLGLIHQCIWFLRQPRPFQGTACKMRRVQQRPLPKLNKAA